MWTSRLTVFHQTLKVPSSQCSCTCRQIHQTSVRLADPTLGRQARMLKKLMVGSKMAKKPEHFIFNRTPDKIYADVGVAPKGVTGIKSKKSGRRVEVLNAVFMEQITSLMATGEVSSDILGLGLTITKVKVSPDFSRVNVYWAASGTERDDAIEPILRQTQGRLRHELTQLRVIGVVPPIEFIRDKTHSALAEVEHLLGKCDFGEDFEPTSPIHMFNPANPGLKLQLKKDSAEESESGSGPKTTAPQTEKELYESVQMRQDMLGVRYDVISEHIKQLVGRTKAKKQQQSIPEAEREIQPDDLGGPQYFEPISSQQAREEIAAAKQRQQHFFKYLKKAQITKSKELKQLTVEAKEKEFYDEEAFLRWKENVEKAHDFEDTTEIEDNFEEETFYSSPR